MEEGRSTPVRPLPSWLRTVNINNTPRSGGKVSDRVHQRIESTPLGPSTLLTNSPSSTEVTPHQTPQGYKGTLSRVFDFATPTVTPRRPARCEKKTRLLRAAINECMRGSRLARNGISPYRKLGLDLFDFSDLLAGCTLLDSANKENNQTPGKAMQPIEVLMVTEIGNWLLDKSVWQEEELTRLKEELESEQQLTASLEDTVSQLRSGIRARDVLEEELAKGERARAGLEHQVLDLTQQLRDMKEVTAHLTERERALETDLVTQVKAAEAGRAEARQRERELTEQILRLEDELSNGGPPGTPFMSGWEPLEIPASAGSLGGSDDVAAMAARNRALEDLVVALQEEVDQLREALEQSQQDHADIVLALTAELSDAQAATAKKNLNEPTSTVPSPPIDQPVQTGVDTSFPEDPAIPQPPNPHPTTSASTQQPDSLPQLATTEVETQQPTTENMVVRASTPILHPPISVHYDEPYSVIATTCNPGPDCGGEVVISESVGNTASVERLGAVEMPHSNEDLFEHREQISPMRSDYGFDRDDGKEISVAGFQASLDEAATTSAPPSPMPQVRSYGLSAGPPLMFENYAMCVPLPPSPPFSLHYNDTPFSPLRPDYPSSPIGGLATSPYPVLANQNHVSMGDFYGEIRLAEDSLLDISPIPHRANRIPLQPISPVSSPEQEANRVSNWSDLSPIRQPNPVEGATEANHSEPLILNVDTTPSRAGVPGVVRCDSVTATQCDQSFLANEPSVIVETVAVPTAVVFVSGPEDHSRARTAAVCANTNTNSAEKRGTALLSAAVALAYATESAATFVGATMQPLPPSPARSEGGIQSDCTTPGQSDRAGLAGHGTPARSGADQFDCTTPLKTEGNGQSGFHVQTRVEGTEQTLSEQSTTASPSAVLHHHETLAECKVTPLQRQNTSAHLTGGEDVLSGEKTAGTCANSVIDTCDNSPIILLQRTDHTQASDTPTTPTMTESHAEQPGDFCSDPTVGVHVTDQEHVAMYTENSTIVDGGDDSQWGPSMLDHSTVGDATMLELQSEVLAHVYMGDHAKLLMKGAWFQKSTRFGRHERFFVVNPMTRIVYWRKRATVGMGSRWAKIAHVLGFTADMNARKGRYTFRFDTGGHELILTTTDSNQYQAWKQALEETIGSNEPLVL